MDPSTSDDALAKLYEVATGMIELLEQSARRGGVNLAGLKTQCFDLMFEAIGASATRLAREPASPLHDRATALAGRMAGFQQTTIDIRLHLIELTEGWKCGTCGRDVAKALTVTDRDPFAVAVVCRNCGAQSPLTARGEQRLHAMIDPLDVPGWDPTVNGFLR